MKYIRACMSSKFGRIRPWTTELAALERRKKIPIDFPHFHYHIFSTVFDRILFMLAGNKDMHKSLDEFEFRPDPTTDYGVSCP